MRKVLSLLSVAFVFSAMAFAAEEVTITGEGQCAKCSLKEAPACQNAIVTEEGGQKVTYYLAKNAVSKAFHKNICSEVKKIKAVGEVTTKDGKKVLTPTKIDVAE